jgi:hypothetical protein
MNGSELLLTLNAIGRLLVRGDIDRVATYYECPLPLYVGNSFILFHSHRRIADALAICHASARRHGVRRIAPTILQVEDSTARRCLAVIRWDHLLTDGTVQSSSVVRYVLRRGALSGRTTVELVEYIEPGLVPIEDMLHPFAAE